MSRSDEARANAVARSRAWRLANPERQRAHERASRARNIDKERARSNAKNAATYRKHRDLLDKIKLEQGCAHCGFDTHPAALQFHHPSDDKAFTVSSSLQRSTHLLLAEVAKCIVLCANCHAIEHDRHRTQCMNDGASDTATSTDVF